MKNPEIGILAIGYNRPDNLLRLLESLNAAFYPEESVLLLISIDHSGSDTAEKAAKHFVWNHGRKIIYTYPRRMGLRAHILHCGSFLERHDLDAMIVLEDDLIAAPSFFQYAVQTVKKYKDCRDIAGISLYTHLWNHYAGYPFCPAKSHYDAYFLQMAQSWGQIWMRNQWSEFIQWYEAHQDFAPSPDFPRFMSNWTGSWLKYHNKFCVEKNRYFVYPYTGFTTCFSEAGEHSVVSASNFQVPMLEGPAAEMRLPDLACEDAVRYDIFYERIGLGRYLNILEEELVVDLYGMKDLTNTEKRYVLSSKELDYHPVRGYALQMRPQEENIIYQIPGKDLFLYDTKTMAQRKTKRSMREADRYVYFHRVYGKTRVLVRVLRAKITEKLTIEAKKAGQRRKKE